MNINWKNSISIRNFSTTSGNFTLWQRFCQIFIRTWACFKESRISKGTIRGLTPVTTEVEGVLQCKVTEGQSNWEVLPLINSKFNNCYLMTTTSSVRTKSHQNHPKVILLHRYLLKLWTQTNKCQMRKRKSMYSNLSYSRRDSHQLEGLLQLREKTKILWIRKGICAFPILSKLSQDRRSLKIKLWQRFRITNKTPQLKLKTRPVFWKIECWVE